MSDKMEKKTTPEVAISRRKIIGDAPIVINEIAAGCLYSGFFGTLDSARIKKTTDSILEIVNRSENSILIIDLSNVEVIDSAIAGHLLKLNKTLQLVGMEVVFCGIKPIVAQSMVSAGVLLDNITVMKNLRLALLEVYRKQGLQLIPRQDKVD